MIVAFIPVVVSDDLTNFKLILCEFMDLVTSLSVFPCLWILGVVRFSNVNEFAVFCDQVLFLKGIYYKGTYI